MGVNFNLMENSCKEPESSEDTSKETNPEDAIIEQVIAAVEEEEEEQDYIGTPLQIIDTAMGTLCNLDSINALTKEDQKYIKQMKRWCLEIAHQQLKLVHTQLFKVPEEPPSSE